VKPLRIVSYNILDGGVGRADPLGEVLQAQDADVIALIEADDPDVVTRIANRLGMDHVTAPGRAHSVALLSRLTITESINHAMLTDGGPRCLLEATVVTPRGLPLAVYAVHFSAGAYDADETLREAELSALLDITAARSAGGAHVLAGDFNSNAPGQLFDVERAKPSTVQAFGANGDKLPRRVIARLLSAGYVDTLSATAGEAAYRQATFSTHRPQQRVDYIFTRGAPVSALQSAWIETDRLAEYASDHFPVGVEINV
jgi:endonuclease/exonuclease/phosphatase family metal-dependent hydrolase